MSSNEYALKSGASLLAALSVVAMVSCGADDDDPDGNAAGSGVAGRGGSSATGGRAGSGGKSAAGQGGSGTAGRGGTAGQGGSAGRGGSAGSTAGAQADGGQAGNGGGQAGADAGSAGTSAGAGGESGSDAGEAPVQLGSAEGFVVLAKSAISTVPTSIITGDLGVSPAAASYITGFSLTADASNVFALSPQVTGRIYASDYASPTPTYMTTAISDMELAFTDAAGRSADVTELGAGDIGGMTLTPGVYAWGTGLLIPTDVTLAGDADAVWIFQIAQDLTVSAATDIVLSGGARPQNVFWQVSGALDLGSTSHFEGIVLTATAITLQTGASINGRLFSQTAVNLDGSTLVEPSE